MRQIRHFSDENLVHYGTLSQNALISYLKKSQICPNWFKSETLWAQINFTLWTYFTDYVSKQSLKIDQWRNTLHDLTMISAIRQYWNFLTMFKDLWQDVIKQRRVKKLSRSVIRIIKSKIDEFLGNMDLTWSSNTLYVNEFIANSARYVYLS